MHREYDDDASWGRISYCSMLPREDPFWPIMDARCIKFGDVTVGCTVSMRAGTGVRS
jgi:hypothetical protein